MICLVFVGMMRGGWKLWSRFDPTRFFGRQTAGAEWNGVVGAFGKLQKEANGGRVCGWGLKKEKKGSAQDRRWTYS
jgi:hypothetical protein